MRSLIATTITTVRPSVTRSKGPKSPRRDKSDEKDNSLRNLIKLRAWTAGSDSPESDFGSIETSNRNVTHVLSTVASTATGIQLKITKQEVRDLPPVDIDHPDGTPADGEDTDDRSGH